MQRLLTRVGAGVDWVKEAAMLSSPPPPYMRGQTSPSAWALDQFPPPTPVKLP